MPIDKTSHMSCTKCNQSQPITNFHKNKTRPSGRNLICKICANEHNKLKYQERKKQEKVWKSYEKQQTAINLVATPPS